MQRDPKNENEEIQKGLEQFLQDEIISYGNVGETIGQESRPHQAIDREAVEKRIAEQNELKQVDISRSPQKDSRGIKQDMLTSGSAKRQNPSKQNKPKKKKKAEPKQPQQEFGRKNQAKNREKVQENTMGKKEKYAKKRKGAAAGNRKIKRKKSKAKKIIAILAVIFLVLAGLWYLIVGNLYQKVEYKRSDELAGEPMKKSGVTNILLIGNDSRDAGDDGRSDAMILLSISRKTKTIHMTSLLRDMYVEIPGKGGNRLNAAYSYGGPTLLLQTVKSNFDVPVNRYMSVNFEAFANVVDAVGGVDLELSSEEVQWVNAYLHEYNLLQGDPIDKHYLDTSQSGMIHLNGPQALAYTRNRYIGTDFGRTERQRKVLGQIMKKLPMAATTNSKELFDGLFPNLTTNLTQKEFYQLSLKASKFLTYDLIQESIPLEGTYKNAKISGMDVLEVDFEQNKKYIQENIYGKK